MDSVYLIEARYIEDFKIFLRFNTGESGEVDLKEVVFKYEVASPLRDPKVFSEFYLIHGRRWFGSADLTLLQNHYISWSLERPK